MPIRAMSHLLGRCAISLGRRSIWSGEVASPNSVRAKKKEKKHLTEGWSAGDAASLGTSLQEMRHLTINFFFFFWGRVHLGDEREGKDTHTRRVSQCGWGWTRTQAFCFTDWWVCSYISQLGPRIKKQKNILDREIPIREMPYLLGRSAGRCIFRLGPG
jgi:hypothetical protein